MESRILKIGEFARIGQVSIKTLRYYDTKGLLEPRQIDPITGYRYYSFDLLPRLNRILALKELGLSLEQIDQLLNEDLTAEQLRGMLRLNKVEIQQQIVEEREKLARVEARLKMIEQDNEMHNYDIVVKKVEPILAATVRDIIPSYPEQGHLWEELETFLAHHHKDLVLQFTIQTNQISTQKFANHWSAQSPKTRKSKIVSFLAWK